MTSGLQGSSVVDGELRVTCWRWEEGQDAGRVKGRRKVKGRERGSRELV